jgi:FkbH-like protein
VILQALNERDIKEEQLKQHLFAELAWLPRSPLDFNDRIRALRMQSEQPASALRALASHALDQNQLSKVARVVNDGIQARRSLAPLTPFRLGVLSNATSNFACTAITGTAPRFGFAIECVSAPFDQALQESIDSASPINASGPDAVLIALDWRGFPLTAKLGVLTDANAVVGNACRYLNLIREGIKQHSGAICIVQNLAPPPERLFGSLDPLVRGSTVSLIRALNDALADNLEGSGDVLFDVEGLASTVGLAQWHSPEEWNLARLAFASEFLPLYADHLCRIIASIRGRTRRCLVMDLDNTIWGGVIGDDGLAGIQVARGDAAGEAYLELQRYALSLRERGILLAVSSKNDDAVARSPFRYHPEMLLREQHLTVFQANWEDKPTNIAAIARELSLGLESMVFLDDNPFERELVRKALPEVAVIELPDDPALYTRTLSAAGCFELTKISAEDFSRGSMYEDNARRTALQNSVGNLDEYLASLQMEIVFKPFDGVGRTRVSQLINKSNQYNLTTRRYSELEVDALAGDPRCFTMQVRLIDRFGDNGMISVVIARGVGSDEWLVDTWVMSCRVLGRKVENMVLKELLRHAKAGGAKTLIGIYIPTGRNGLVENHYQELGFERSSEGADGTITWRLPIPARVDLEPTMEVRRSGFQLLETAAT